MDIKNTLDRIKILFESIDDVEIHECEETSLVIVETNTCYTDIDDPGKNFDIYLSMEVNPSNDWEYSIYSYLENSLGDAEPLSIHRYGNGLESFCKDLNRSYELEDGQGSDWKSPRLLYRILSE